MFQCKRTSKFKKHWYKNKSNSFQFRVLFFFNSKIDSFNMIEDC